VEPDQLLTVREVSHYLRLARSTVYRLAQNGRLPGRKVGGTWRFPRRGLDEWLAQQAPPAARRPAAHPADAASAPGVSPVSSP